MRIARRTEGEPRRPCPGGRRRARPGALPLLLVAFWLVVAGCGIPPQYLNTLYDAYSQGTWFRKTSPGAALSVPYVPGGTREQTMDIYRPQDVAPAPVVVFVHGGAWQYGDPAQYAALAKALVKRGYVAMLPGYRKYPGVTYPAFCEDVVAALNFAVAHAAEYGGDPDRILVAGHSAGAHLIAIAFTDDRFRGRLAFDPLAIRGLAPLSGPFDFSYARKQHLQTSVRRVMSTPENYQAAQPIRHVRGDLPPVLVLIGSKDDLTPAVQARNYADALRVAGADVRYVELPGGDHYTVMLDFLEGHEGPAAEQFFRFAQEVTAPRAGSEDRPSAKPCKPTACPLHAAPDAPPTPAPAE